MHPELDSILREGRLVTKEPSKTKALRQFNHWADHVRAYLAASGSRLSLKLRFLNLREDLAKIQLVHSRQSRSPVKLRTVFVVHGRNEVVRRAMFDFLRSLSLAPLEWPTALRRTRRGSPFVGDVLDRAFRDAQAIVVLMTPDDLGELKKCYITRSDGPSERSLTGQPRLNVVFEAGMAFGRYPNRTILVEIGTVRPISDIAGRHAVRFDGSFQKRRDLANRLKTAGCPVEDSGTDWVSAGKFPVAG